MRNNNIWGLRQTRTDGWYVAQGSRHTSIVSNAVHLTKAEAREWLEVWGHAYEIVNLKLMKDVE